MKTVKILFTVIALFFFANTSFGQSAKMETKAAEKTEQINQLLTSVDESLALKPEQKEKIQALQIKKLKDIKALEKAMLPD